ncbi:MAG TPA: AIR synthase-related protein, partial [Trueperaceae bacterium]|nr:AIR synthase-related protein [Trueperaceae bacterium]
LVAAGICDTAHDVSTGGLAVAAAEMAMAGGKGARLTLSATANVPLPARSDTLLFGETAATVLAAVPRQHLPAVHEACLAAGVAVSELGIVGGSDLSVSSTSRDLLSLSVAEMRAAHEHTFAEALG